MSLIAHWKCEDNAATTVVVDSSPSANNGVASGNTSGLTTTGKIGNGFLFGDYGTGKYFGSSDTDFNITNELAVGCWFFPTSPPNGEGRTIISRYTYHAADPDTGWNLGETYGSSDQLRMTVYDVDGVSHSASLNWFYRKYIGSWVFVMGLFKANEYVKLYLNGSLVNTDSTGIPATITYESALTIGLRANRNQSECAGKLDGIRIYNHIPPDDEILALYNSGLGINNNYVYYFKPSYIYTEDIGHRTNILTMEDGGEQRNSYGTARRIFTLNYDRVTEAKKDLIVAFYDARYGRYETFGWANPNDSNTEYTVRFVPEGLEIEEVDYQMYNIKLQLIQVI